MNNLSLSFGAFFLAVSVAACATDQPAPMPQTRGMAGMDPKMHDPANQPVITCSPKAGTESMAHAPGDHPMPDTRGMHGMDPAQHMKDCHSSDETPPPKLGPHQHKTNGS